MKSNKNKIIWGIIGCGDVAEIKSGPAFQKCNHSELLAVMRRDSVKAKDFAKRHSVPLWYDDARQLLKNDEINAVYIATPPSPHLEYALEALKAGKDVYLEKPMVISKAEALILADAVNKSNNKLVVAHYRRQLPMFLKVKSIIDSNGIGTIQFVDIKYLRTHQEDMNTNWRLDSSISGGDYFHDIAPHQIDLIYHFFGDCNSAHGVSVNQQKGYQASGTVNGIIDFKNGIQFRGIWDFDCSKYAETDNCTIYGSNGVISFSFFGNRVNVISDKGEENHKFQHPENIQYPFIQKAVDYFLGQSENPCSVEEGTVVSTIMDAFTKKILNKNSL